MAEPVSLDVYVGESRVGVLGANPEGLFIFTYLPETPPELLVSLTMPVRAESYKWGRGGLHPYFRMNLPEGAKKDLIRQRLGALAQVTDIGLLAFTGQRTIGRVSCVPQGQPLASILDNLQVATLLASPNSRELLLQHLEAGVTEGVSGVMPKLLRGDKTTMTTEEYIVKTGRPDLPGLSINEYLCLRAAARAGLVVPETFLSDDGEVLAIRRFDRPAAGPTLGVEDFCSLQGNDPESKYDGSLENIAARLKDYVPPKHFFENATRLFKLLLLNYAIHNADAHLKNFALTYTSLADVALAPVYDILTVTAFPTYATNIPGLTLEGKKVWACGKSLHKYAAQRLQLSPTVRADALYRVTDALQNTFKDIQVYAEKYPFFRPAAKRMMDEWEKGIAGIQPTASARVLPPGDVRALLGMSNLEPEHKESNAYKNPDGAFSHKAR
ncbi:type II toxin-antitoxin system HipA family toxin [Propionivibrio sp.]|uniref:type II toxin-antitoxin system HipA family toxin n=1 Tax=Propionivibrio sp. TaxID=2212460 RepID=UPI003BF1550A